jgi:tetratricopeptide (TPR) repeat protein
MALVIFAATVWLYWPSVHGEFLGGDDNEYLRQSEQWNGLTWNAVKWAFTSTDSFYHPLPRLSHVLDYQMWGKNVVGHHATSVAVHALNAALVFGFLWTLLGATSLTTGERLTVALWVAVVFAIHPLQVESVAWISGRTQLLCTTFGIVCLWAYVLGARWWTVLVLFVAALLCKPMAVSLPFVMLAMDYYPLQRYKQLGWGRLIGEKMVMVILGVAVGVATIVTRGDRIATLGMAPLSQRLLFLCQSLVFYPSKLLWPSHLAVMYPMRFLSFSQGWVLAWVVTVVMVAVVVVYERRRNPVLLATCGAYALLLLPVSGLLPTDAQVVEQRYAYMTMLPLLLLAGAAGVWIWRRSTTVACMGLVGLAIGQLCALGIRTRGVIPDWHDQETLGRVAITESPDSEMLNRGVAMFLLDHGRAGEALVYAQRDVQIAPQLWLSHMTLGRVLGRLGRLQEAMAEDEQALRMNNDSAEAHYNFGAAMLDLGKAPTAVEHFEQALRIKSDYAEAHHGFGLALMELGKAPTAVEHYEQALRIKPDYADAHNDLGTALAQTGKFEEAIAQYEQALRIDPDYAEAHSNLGNVFLLKGKVSDAIEHYEEALQLKPDYADAHFNLGNALAQVGRAPEAIAQYEQALKLQPDFTAARNALTRLRAGQ